MLVVFVVIDVIVVHEMLAMLDMAVVSLVPLCTLSSLCDLPVIRSVEYACCACVTRHARFASVHVVLRKWAWPTVSMV